jgi:nucleotide-binding universal stress UspA family protein
MSVAVAHKVSTTGSLALRQAAHEARLRQTDLAVIHVVESLDFDIGAAHRAGISDEVTQVLKEAEFGDLTWDLHLVTGTQDVADTVLRVASEVNAEILVIGARRRSPVGKFLLGSVAQTLILDADIPVVVVKSRG